MAGVAELPFICARRGLGLPRFLVSVQLSTRKAPPDERKAGEVFKPEGTPPVEAMQPAAVRDPPLFLLLVLVKPLQLPPCRSSWAFHWLQHELIFALHSSVLLIMLFLLLPTRFGWPFRLFYFLVRLRVGFQETDV